jgi:ankyrin repeat protein
MLKKCKKKQDGNELPSPESALRRASISGRTDIMRILLDSATNLNINEAGSESGKTALHFAVIGKHIDAAKLLIQCKANTDIVDKNGKTALDYAKESGNEEMCTLFPQSLQFTM